MGQRSVYDMLDIPKDLKSWMKETVPDYKMIKKDKRYREYIDSISEEELAGDVYMDATLDRIETRGEARGTNMVNQLGILLSKTGRLDDFLRSLSDREFQKELFAEFGLKKEK